MKIKETILTDEPLTDPKNDLLGFKEFAKNLAKLICNIETNEPLVFAIYGEWGSGKTTCLNFVLHYINKFPKEKRPLIIHFDPWWFSGKGDLLYRFLIEFTKVLNKEKEKFKDVIEKITKFAGILSKIPEPTGIITQAAEFVNNLGKEFIKYEEVWKLRESIKKNLKKQNIKFLLIIDDIDRLPAEEIRDLFRVIKAIADFPKTIYLLAFDKKVVIKALESFQNINGEEYLKKIVQVPLELPLLDKFTLRNFFIEQLNIIFKDTPEELFNKERFLNIFYKGIDFFLKNIRDIKHLINTIKLTYPLVKGEVNAVDFITIESLRVFVPDLYYLIRNNPEIFTGHSSGDIYPGIGDIRAILDKFFTPFPENEVKIIKDILKRTFPKLEAVWDGSYYDSQWLSIWRRELRVCSPEKFPLYFRLSIPVDEISNYEMRSILEQVENIKEFRKRLIRLTKQKRRDGSTRLSVFLERLLDFIDDISSEKAYLILETIFDIGDKFILPEDEVLTLFGFGNDTRVLRVTYKLLNHFDTQQERFKVLKRAFSNGKAISVITLEIITRGQEHGKHGGREKPEKDCMISKTQLEELEKIVLNKIIEFSQKNKLLKTPMLPSVLYFWRTTQGEEIVKEWVKKATKEDKNLVNFLVTFLSLARSGEFGSKVAGSRWYIDPKRIEPYLDTTKILKRCENLLKKCPSWLKGRKKLAVEAFIEGYKLRKEGKEVPKVM